MNNIIAENLISRRRALHLVGVGLAGSVIGILPTVAADNPVLVELFTSQGCSDCPPADKLAGELKRLPGIQVISLNVDYWDYLGWHDTLGKREYTKRQNEYAKSRGDNEVYTPQVVINGERHAVGSNRSAVEAAIAAARGNLRNIPVSANIVGDKLHATVGALAGEKGTLWAFGIAPEVSVAIAKGENAGTNVVYHNVARKLVALGEWDGSAKSFSMPADAAYSDDCRSCLCVLQKGHIGPVLGMVSLAV